MSPRKTYILKLYVAGNTPNSMRALKTLRDILETEFRGVYALKVIDVLKNPQLAEEDKILATPTLCHFNQTDEHDPLLIWPRPNEKTIGTDESNRQVLYPCDFTFQL